MQTSLRLTTQVLPGGRVEVTNAQLRAGEAVDVVILFTQKADTVRRSVLEVLTESPGQLAFQTADNVDAYLREERDAWDR